MHWLGLIWGRTLIFNGYDSDIIFPGDCFLGFRGRRVFPRLYRVEVVVGFDSACGVHALAAQSVQFILSVSEVFSYNQFISSF